MSKETKILIAGFGGQGVLFAGKVIAYCGLIEDKELSWLPSYGPEMRGGTANCSVVLSDAQIGSPLVTSPDVLIAMNQPSFDKFVGECAKDAIVIVDESLVPDADLPADRSDIKLYKIDAQNLCEENELAGLGNVAMVGKLFSLLPFCKRETIDAAIDKCVPKSKEHLIVANKKAIQLGIDN